MVGRTNTGGGGSGGTLTVTGIAGHTVTATKDGKTYTRTFNSGGVAVFKGLSTGTWTLTMTGGGQTATRTVDVTADYAVTITYFSATIKVTYPAKSKCVIKNSSGTQVASDTNTGTSAKTWTATVGATGTYTVTATSTDGSGNTKSDTVSITSDGQSASVTLSYRYYLFKEGEGVADNWGTAGNAILVQKNDNAIAIKSNEGYGGNNNYKAYIRADLTKYKALKAEIKTTIANKPIVGVFGPDVPDLHAILASSASATKQNIREVVSLDISSISGQRYVGIHVGSLETLYMYNFWLE